MPPAHAPQRGQYTILAQPRHLPASGAPPLLLCCGCSGRTGRRAQGRTGRAGSHTRRGQAQPASPHSSAVRAARLFHRKSSPSPWGWHVWPRRGAWGHAVARGRGARPRIPDRSAQTHEPRRSQSLQVVRASPRAGRYACVWPGPLRPPRPAPAGRGYERRWRPPPCLRLACARDSSALTVLTAPAARAQPPVLTAPGPRRHGPGAAHPRGKIGHVPRSRTQKKYGQKY